MDSSFTNSESESLITNCGALECMSCEENNLTFESSITSDKEIDLLEQPIYENYDGLSQILSQTMNTSFFGTSASSTSTNIQIDLLKEAETNYSEMNSKQLLTFPTESRAMKGENKHIGTQTSPCLFIYTQN